MKSRQLKQTQENVQDLEDLIRGKLKTSFYTVKSHEAGYQINIDESIEKNWIKIQQIPIAATK